MVLAQKSRNSATLPGLTPPPPPAHPAPPVTTPPPAQPDPPDENLPPANNNAPPPLTVAANTKGSFARERNGGESPLPCADCDNGNSYVPAQDPNFTDTRIAPRNDKGGSGVTLGSRNYNWGMNLVHLPGRAGMDLDISLSYNSLVWAREGSIIKFNADRGWPAPGFEMGWPTLEAGYAASVTPPPGQPSAYVVTWPSGGHTRLTWGVEYHPFLGGIAVYRSDDSSQMKLQQIAPSNGYPANSFVLFTGGTSLLFVPRILWDGTTRHVCTEITDRNGNRQQITYDNYAHPLTVTDTNGRVVNFVYDDSHNLIRITQTRNGDTFIWAEFAYTMKTLAPNFAAGFQINQPADPNITVLDRVQLPDGSTYRFTYNSYGQVIQFARHAPDETQMAYTWYDAAHRWIADNPLVFSDCPRITVRRDWAKDWNNGRAVTTKYSSDPASENGGQPAWSQVETPNGTRYKEIYFTGGWLSGLPYLSEVYAWNGSFHVKKKWTTTGWIQDNTNENQSFPINPRPHEINIYDDPNSDDIPDNRRKTEIDYYGNLPSVVREYDADGLTIIRRTETEYLWDYEYFATRLLGLVKERRSYGRNNVLESKQTFDYDLPDTEYLVNLPATPTGHNGADTWYNVGRGNLNRVWQWDVTNANVNNENGVKRQVANYGYNITGSLVFNRDALGHTARIDYTDRYSNGVNYNTYAYPTRITDPLQNTLSPTDRQHLETTYQRDTGLVTRTKGLRPQGATQDVIQTLTYDAVDRVERVDNLTTGDYTRYEYFLNENRVAAYRKVDTGLPEFKTEQITDGAGRLRAVRAPHLGGAANRFVGQYTRYDNMGRVVQRSNPTEMDGNWTAVGDDAANGWVWTVQQYDWQSRPTVTVNPDGTQRVTEYDGCGCAGGQVVTTRDEAGRQRKYSHDVLGRLAQVQELQYYPSQSVYATTRYTYNGRDQLTLIKQFAGSDETDPQARLRSFGFDGYGRLNQRTTPEQGTTSYEYYANDTVYSVTDARQVVTTFTYDPRNLVKTINYAGNNAAPTAPVTFEYDAVGNRTQMQDGLGLTTYGYDAASRLTTETRPLNGTNYTLQYAYTSSGALKSFTNQGDSPPSSPPDSVVNYGYDASGRLTSVTGSGAVSAANYLSNALYRAFGAPKEVTYGNGRKLSLNYNKRLFLTSWDLPNVNEGANTPTTALGYNYQYNKYGENNTGRPDFAQSLYDSTLDRAWTYDQVGRLAVAYTGVEAHAQWGTATGPYAQGFSYDVYGNITARAGWGGANAAYTASVNSQNQLTSVAVPNGPTYNFDYGATTTGNAGYLMSDGQQSYQYDATGQQTFASGNGGLTMGYDGNGLRVQKIENGSTTWYLRSTVLGGQVVAEFTGNTGASNTWQRGYIYTGGQLLAIQEVAVPRVLWVHQEPYSKGQRLTDATGAIVSRLEFDPFGGAVANNLAHTPPAGWTANEAVQKRKYTSYERDANGGDEAHFRRYEKNWSRFSQPDPYDGSVSLANPQSLNRYGYVSNDPINFVDPTGLCKFKVIFNVADKGVYSTNPVIDGAKTEIARIFNQAGHSVTFDPKVKADAILNYSLVPGTSKTSPTAGGTTYLGSNNGAIFAGRLIQLASKTFFEGGGTAGYTLEGMGLAFGRIAAHEFVTHALLLIAHTPSGLTRANFEGETLFSGGASDLYNISPEQAKLLKDLCTPALLPQPIIAGMGGGGGELGGYGGGGGYPAWWHSLWGFVRFISEIPVGRASSRVIWEGEPGDV